MCEFQRYPAARGGDRLQSVKQLQEIRASHLRDVFEHPLSPLQDVLLKGIARCPRVARDERIEKRLMLSEGRAQLCAASAIWFCLSGLLARSN